MDIKTHTMHTAPDELIGLYLTWFSESRFTYAGKIGDCFATVDDMGQTLGAVLS